MLVQLRNMLLSESLACSHLQGLDCHQVIVLDCTDCTPFTWTKPGVCAPAAGGCSVLRTRIKLGWRKHPKCESAPPMFAASVSPSAKSMSASSDLEDEMLVRHNEITMKYNSLPSTNGWLLEAVCPMVLILLRNHQQASLHLKSAGSRAWVSH